jgi:hypothetical protein
MEAIFQETNLNYNISSKVEAARTTTKVARNTCSLSSPIKENNLLQIFLFIEIEMMKKT